MPDDAALRPDPDASIEFLKRWAPDGPWVLVAILTSRKGITAQTFRPADEEALRAWLGEHDQDNLYFHVNPTLRDLDKKAERADVAALAWLHDAILQAMVAMPRSGQLSVKIVGDDEMARAHETHKDRPGTTDVLTFDLSAGEAPLDADLLVCADEARRQALARGHLLEQEVLLYVVHGVLHCTGYDDDNAAAAELQAGGVRVNVRGIHGR